MPQVIKYGWFGGWFMQVVVGHGVIEKRRTDFSQRRGEVLYTHIYKNHFIRTVLRMAGSIIRRIVVLARVGG